MMLPRVRREKKIRPLGPRELDAVRNRRKDSHSGLIDRLVATCDLGTVQEKQECAACKYRQPEVKWIGYPDLEPKHRTANDWLRLAIMALSEYEIQKLEDELRTKGKWHLWNDVDT